MKSSLLKRRIVSYSNPMYGAAAEWGVEAANKWARGIRAAIFKMLGSFPESQPIAPDNDEFEIETRQMIVGRYRILFAVQKRTVTVLHIRGPFNK